MTTETAPRTATPPPLYLRLWAGLPRDLGYLLAAFPVAVIGFGLGIGLFSAAAGSIATIVFGLVFLVAALYLARGVGTVELALLRFARRPEIRRPDWRDRTARTGIAGWLRALFANPHYWLYLVWTVLVNFVVATVTFTIAVTWTSIALGGVTAWFWSGFLPDDRDFSLSTFLVERVLRVEATFDGHAGDIVLQAILGVVFLALAPFVLRGLTWIHWGVARGMLGAFRTVELEREVATLAESRTAAVAAEGSALRRLERDIHDGPQQRLVRLQMDLAAAERQLESDPDAARRLLAEAAQQSRDALEELRALSRGFAPPILLDRGLVAALESLAVRSAVTVRVVSELPADVDLPTELERNAYFIAAEGLTNAVKHSGGSAIDLRLALRRIPDPDETWLDVTVADDGRGGAVAVPEHGLAGLQDRVRGLGGSLELSSTAGSGTTLVAHLPVTRAVS